MKKWKINIKTVDLDEAITYLNIVLSAFKAAKSLGLPMESTYADDPKTGSSIDCKEI